MKNKYKCKEIARIKLKWGDEMFNYCPVHANNLILFAQAGGIKIDPEILPSMIVQQCQSHEPLTFREKLINKSFKIMNP